MSFSGKHALIVGGSSGMGLQAGHLLLKAGASVTLVGSRIGDESVKEYDPIGASFEFNTWH